MGGSKGKRGKGEKKRNVVMASYGSIRDDVIESPTFEFKANLIKIMLSVSICLCLCID